MDIMLTGACADANVVVKSFCHNVADLQAANCTPLSAAHVEQKENWRVIWALQEHKLHR